MALIISLAINDKTILTAEAVRIKGEPTGACNYRVRVWAEGQLDGDPARGKWEFELKHSYGDGAVVLSRKIHDILFEIENLHETVKEPVEYSREMSSHMRTEFCNGIVGGSDVRSA